MRIDIGYYSINDIKSFFKKTREEEDDDDIEIGEIIEMRINEYPPVDIVVEVISIEMDGLLLAEILEVHGVTDEHVEGDIIFIPPEIFEWE